MNPRPDAWIYLGDGVLCRVDAAGTTCLKNETDCVALEPAALKAFLLFVEGRGLYKPEVRKPRKLTAMLRRFTRRI